MSEPTAQDELRPHSNNTPPPPTKMPPKRDAFSALMSTKPRPREPKQVRGVQPTNPRDVRNGLLPYILKPESFPSSLIIRHTEHTVLIKDRYPKSLLHLLLLPRDATKYNLHPHTAFADPVFLALIRSEISECVNLAASELSRLLSSTSLKSLARLKAMDSSFPAAELPPGRDFAAELRVGIHAHPSMNHLHIHIISPDMSQETMRHRKHYNSFNTDFFIPLQDFPLVEDDVRRRVEYQNANLSRDFKCWRCGRMFGNKFKELKEHMATEFVAWKEE